MNIEITKSAFFPSVMGLVIYSLAIQGCSNNTQFSKASAAPNGSSRATSLAQEDVGQTGLLSGTDSGNGNTLTVQQVSVSQAGTLESLSFYVDTAAGSLVLGVYDSTGVNGGPGNLVGQTASFTPAAGWNTQSVITPKTMNTGSYWLAYLPSSNNLVMGKVVATGQQAEWINYNFGAMPNSFGAALGIGDSNWSIYATLSTSSCTTATLVSSSSYITPATVAPGGTFNVYCNYGFESNSMGVSTNGANCTFVSFSGTTELSTCTATTSLGTYTVSCNQVDIAPNYFCAETNPVGTLVVTSASPSPSPSPSPSSTSAANYVGCYSDTSARALPSELATSGATVESCVAAAKAAGYTYAGVQYGGQCFAGNTLGFTLSASTNCNMPCTANSNEICGGTWYNSIYSTGVTSSPSPSPSPSPTSTSSNCTTENFVSGSLSASSVSPGGPFTVSCNYGPAVTNTGSIAPPASYCSWTSWNGNSAVFNCTAPAAAGSYPFSCTLMDISPNDFCAQTNSIGSLTVTGASPSPSPSPSPSSTAPSGPNVTVNWNSTFQTMDGFGGENGGPWSWASYPYNWNNMDSATAASLFSASSGIGISIYRTDNVDGTSSSLPPDMGSMEQAHNLGAQIELTLQSPPSSMKYSGHQTFGDGTQGASGSCLASSYSAYATYVVQLIQNIQSSGNLTVSFLSVQNEPGSNNGTNTVGFGYCIWSAAALDSFVKVLGPALSTAGLSTKIILGEMYGYANSPNYFGTCMNDASCAPYVSVISGHGYGYPDTPVAPGTGGYPALSTGKHLWQGETCDQGSFDASMTSALSVAENMQAFLQTGEVSSYNWWELGYINSGGSSQDCSLIGTSSSGANVYTKRFYAFGNFSKFVRPGMVMIGTTNNPVSGVTTTAFKDTATGKFAIVVVNGGGSSQALSYTLSGFPSVSSVTPALTSASSDLADQAAVGVSGGGFNYVIPAQSVITFHN